MGIRDHILTLLSLGFFMTLGVACKPPEDDTSCGPKSGSVVRVIDGDTLELGSGETVRLLMVDTPETTGGATDCYGQQAKAFTTAAVLGKTIELRYDVECEDAYNRLLAFVTVDGSDLNLSLVQQGYACVLRIPPNGADEAYTYTSVQRLSRDYDVGMWGVCAEVACAD